MIFKILVTISLLLTAGTTAFMAIFSMCQIFPTFIMPIALMTVGFECGKLVAVVYTHRNWKVLRALSKFYYCGIVFCLVLITSSEIFGFLSQSYTETGSRAFVISSRLSALEKERDNYRERLDRLEKTLSELPQGYVTRRLKERRAAGYDELNNNLVRTEKEIADAKAILATESIKAGPIFSIAKLFSAATDTVVLIFILALVGVVEPLSIGLTVAVSYLWMVSPAGVYSEKMSYDHAGRIREALMLRKIKENKK